MGKKRKKKGKGGRRGHFCWCCQRELANEEFSGRGHRDHICKDCQKKPKEERAFVQAVRDIDRCVDWEGRLRRKQRRHFEQFLHSSDERVRAYAQEVAARDAAARREEREDWFRANLGEEFDELLRELSAAERAWRAASNDGDWRSADMAAERVWDVLREIRRLLL